MAKASDNAFPSILITEGTEPSAPAAGKQRLYIDSTTHKLKRTDSSGTDVTIEAAAGAIATDTIWDAKGDLAAATGADAASKLTVGANDTVLMAASGQSTGLKWSYPVLTVSENFITSDVSVSSADTFFDGPSLSLAAGTYVLWGNLLVKSTVAGHWEVKLWDGASAVYHTAENYALTNGATYNIPVFGTAVLGGTTTIKISGARNAGSGTHTILDAAQVNGTADKGTHLVALRIA